MQFDFLAVLVDGGFPGEDFDALVALGCIIRGETYHFELVANESGAAVTRVSLDNKIPIVVFNMDTASNFRDAVLGRKVGTLVCE